MYVQRVWQNSSYINTIIGQYTTNSSVYIILYYIKYKNNISLI